MNRDLAFWLQRHATFYRSLENFILPWLLVCLGVLVLMFHFFDHIEEANNIKPVSLEGEPTPSNIVMLSGPVEPVVEESTSFLNQTRSDELDARLADGEPILPVSVFISYSLLPNSILAEKLNFTRSHPFQPTRHLIEKPSFDLASIQYRKLTPGSVSRSWVTLENREQKVKSILCSICIAFSNEKLQFVAGFTNFMHAHRNIEEHENLKGHIARAYTLQLKHTLKLKIADTFDGT